MSHEPLSPFERCKIYTFQFSRAFSIQENIKKVMNAHVIKPNAPPHKLYTGTGDIHLQLRLQLTGDGNYGKIEINLEGGVQNEIGWLSAVTFHGVTWNGREVFPKVTEHCYIPLSSSDLSSLQVLHSHTSLYQPQCVPKINKSPTKSKVTDVHYLSDGALVINVNGSVIIKDSVENLDFKKTAAEDDLIQDIASMFEDPRYSDVEIHVGSKKFAVHKNILSSRSQGFTDLLEDFGNRNVKKNVITICDFTPDVVKEALYFIYTGNSTKVEIMAPELLTFAEKFKVSSLKIICEEEISSSIMTDNVAYFLDLALDQRAVKLQNFCIDFIKSNVTSVINTIWWEKLILKHPNLLEFSFKGMSLPDDSK